MKLTVEIGDLAYRQGPISVNQYIQEYSKRRHMKEIVSCRTSADLKRRCTVITIEGPRMKRLSRSVVIAKRFKRLLGVEL